MFTFQELISVSHLFHALQQRRGIEIEMSITYDGGLRKVWKEEAHISVCQREGKIFFLAADTYWWRSPAELDESSEEYRDWLRLLEIAVI